VTILLQMSDIYLHIYIHTKYIHTYAYMELDKREL